MENNIEIKSKPFVDPVSSIGQQFKKHGTRIKALYHNEAHVPAVQIVLSSYIKALKNMDDVLFQSLFYDQLSPIYGVYKENGKEVKIRLHA